MASSIEDILLARALADADSKPDPAVAMGGGAAVGGILGVLGGQVPHSIGNVLGAKPRMRPGFRMAGGLVGAILGGGLGIGVRQAMINESPAANMLAKMQSQGRLDITDQYELQKVLKDIYNNPGSMA